MRLLQLLMFGLSVVAIFACPLRAEDSAEKSKAETEWAEGVLRDFLTAVNAGDTPQAASLVSSELKNACMEAGVKMEAWLRGRIAQKVYTSWRIESKQRSPDGGEILFKGSLEGGDEGARFTIRVSRESEGAKWRVSYMGLEPYRVQRGKEE